MHEETPSPTSARSDVGTPIAALPSALPPSVGTDQNILAEVVHQRLEWEPS